MANYTGVEKHRIEGMDCAQCAHDIEVALRKIDGFEEATVSFATETVAIPTGGKPLAEQVIARVEPSARLKSSEVEAAGSKAGETPTSDHIHADHGVEVSGAWRVVRIGIAIILAVTGVAFYRALHATPYHIAEYLVFLSAYLLAGAPVLAGAVRNILRGKVFDEMFLMTIATLGAIAIHEFPEAVAVMLFYSVGEYVQDLAVGRSRRSIASLMDLRPESARVVTDETIRELSPEQVEVGAIIEVLAGERIPLDGEVIDGETSVDTSALTGESIPRSVSIGDTVFAGFVNDSGRIRIRVARRFSESSVSRILELVEDAASRKAPTERFISRFAQVYTPIMVAIAAVVAFLPPLIVPGALLSEWVYRALVVLVISCPCALVLSIPLGYFGGIGGASRHGVLIKGANFIDALKDVHTVVFDKTGTLTKGVFQVTKIVPRNGSDPDTILQWAAAVESQSSHPIARSIRDAYGSELDPVAIDELSEERGYGIVATVHGRRVIAGSDRLLHRERITHTDCDAEGTVVYLAVDGTYLGYMLISDEIKEEAADAISDLRACGVERIVMLTGDNEHIARRVSRDVGIDEYFAKLLPEEKVSRVEELAAELPDGKRLAFVGDGINDAPVLMRSDIGIAMGALGSDAAIEAADVVLMDDRVSGISRAIRIARFTRRIVLENIALALVVKATFLALGAIGIATMWEAVISDVGVSLLAVLNATRTLRRKYRERPAMVTSV